MKFYLKQNSCPAAGLFEFFTVYGECGSPLYRFLGERNSFTSKIRLQDFQGLERAHITRVGTAVLSQYVIYSQGRSQAFILHSIATKGQPYRIKGIDWTLAGNIYTRNYEIRQKSGALVMRHSSCWKAAEPAFSLDIMQECDRDLALCIATIIDSTLVSGEPTPVPVS